jgi:hypothetical protein
MCIVDKRLNGTYGVWTRGAFGVLGSPIYKQITIFFNQIASRKKQYLAKSSCE